MFTRIIASASLIGVLLLIGYEYFQAIEQQEKLKVFVNAGPRFTAYDGVELCEFQNLLATHSIGFQQSGLPLLDCKKYLHVRK